MTFWLIGDYNINWQKEIDLLCTPAATPPPPHTHDITAQTSITWKLFILHILFIIWVTFWMFKVKYLHIAPLISHYYDHCFSSLDVFGLVLTHDIKDIINEWMISILTRCWCLHVWVFSGKQGYLLRTNLWKCCMSDEDESATAFVMQWRWPIKYRTLLSVMLSSLQHFSLHTSATGQMWAKQL